MTKQELKTKILSSGVVYLVIYGRDLMIATEKLLLENGWAWADGHHEPYIPIHPGLRYLKEVTLCIRTSGNTNCNNFNSSAKGLKRYITYSTSTDTETETSTDVIIVTESMLRELKMVFNPGPNYNPRKITREI